MNVQHIAGLELWSELYLANIEYNSAQNNLHNYIRNVFVFYFNCLQMYGTNTRKSGEVSY